MPRIKPTKAVCSFDAGTRRSNPGPSAIAAILQIGDLEFSESEYIGDATNNFAEWSALLLGLNLALRIGDMDLLEIHSDSKLVVQQALGVWKVRRHLRPLYETAQEMALVLKNRGVDVQIKHVPRSENEEADRLVTDLLDSFLGKKRGY